VDVVQACLMGGSWMGDETASGIHALLAEWPRSLIVVLASHTKGPSDSALPGCAAATAECWLHEWLLGC
jgi:hypothetical protein